MKWFLRVGGDTYEQMEQHKTLKDAKDSYFAGASQLARWGHELDAAVYRGCDSDYPDYVLSIGPKGGLKCERA